MSTVDALATRSSLLVWLALAALGSGCGSSGDGGASGGSNAIASGGVTNSGGATSSGGVTNSGGTTSSGGVKNSGGTSTSGSGGATTAGGGATTTGGVTTSGGATTAGSGGAMASGGVSTGGTGGTSGAAGGVNKGGAGMGAAGSAGKGGTSAGGASSGGAGTAGGSGGASTGCGKAPTLKNSTGTSNFNYNTITSGGASRRYIVRWPDNYDNMHPYRLILGFHGATGNGGQVAGNPAYFGLFALANSSTIFIAPDAVDGLWNAASDTTLVDDILKQVKADLCIDTSRILLEGFSQGGAMVRTLACGRPGVFRAAAALSAGGLAVPSSCMPVPYFGSLGLQESTGANGQTTQTDFFAKANGCTLDKLPTAPTGGHVCTDYPGCSPGFPTRWCSFDGPHTPAPTDGGKSWMPTEVWTFFSQF